MPTYSKTDITQIIQEEEFEKMMKATPSPRDRLFLALLYCTGARPSEVSGDPYRGIPRMTWGQLLHSEHEKYIEKNKILIKMYTSKRKKGSFSVKERRLSLSFDDKDHIDLPIRIVFDAMILKKKQLGWEKRELDPKEPIFDFTRRTGYNIAQRAGKIIGRSVCGYNFRHSRLTILSELGAGIETLLNFKGSDNIGSITPYLHAKESDVRLSRRKEP